MKYRFLLITFCLLIASMALSQGLIEVKLNSGISKYTSYVYFFSGNLINISTVSLGGKKGEKIRIDEVSYVKGADSEGIDRYIIPIRYNRSHIWAERFYTSEKIDIYYTSILSDSWNSVFKAKYFLYSKNGSSPKKLTASNLKRELSDNKESMKLIKRGQAFFGGQMVLYGIGATLIGIDIYSELSSDVNPPPPPGQEDNSVSPTFIAGIGFLLSPWLLNGPRQNSYLEALTSYE